MQKLKYYGCGGQGVVTAGKVTSIAVSIHEDKYAITVPAYGHERRGAPVYTDLMVDDKPIMLNCYVYSPDYVVVFDDSVIDKGIDVGQGKHDGTVLVLNAPNEERARHYKEQFGFDKVYWVDATEIAYDTIGIGIPNGSTLGCLARSGVVGIESVEKALNEFFGPKAGPKNALAARRSYEQTHEM
jgi:2-oxoacid:acceptor oxidoreductase gamma subunit (pyruvate/2-ketoisovalerate family)